MPRRKIATWAKITEVARQRFPHHEQAVAIAIHDAFEAAEAAPSQGSRESYKRGRETAATADQAVEELRQSMERDARVATAQSLERAAYGSRHAAAEEDRKSTRLNSSHITRSRMPSSA